MSSGRTPRNGADAFGESRSILLGLQGKAGKTWPLIQDCAQTATAKLAEIEKTVAGLDSEDTSIVVFGSLARAEWTSGSDVDWTLLIDGQADPGHLQAIVEIQEKLAAAKYSPPGTTGVFGNMAFSHELIHRIGGEADTNRNITQRVLLLLESKPVGRSEAYDRVVRQVLRRYLSNGVTDVDAKPKVPRFLLNDIVRFWRTMAVDFAFKKQARAGQKWALRNAKLRMSRKLIFAAGLIMCLTCDDSMISKFSSKSTSQRLEKCVRKTPLGILAEAVLVNQTPVRTIQQMFDSYEQFLALLDNVQKRRTLENLREEDKDECAVYQEVRSLGKAFERSLEDFFFEQDRVLYELTKKLGVF